MKYQNFLNKLFLPDLFSMFTWYILEQNSHGLSHCQMKDTCICIIEYTFNAMFIYLSYYSLTKFAVRI